MQKTISSITALLLLAGCSSNSAKTTPVATPEIEGGQSVVEMAFDADSAYSYVKRQTDFGPRVPGTAAHTQCGDWLSAELRRHGAEVTEQVFSQTTFDGKNLTGRNIIGQYNPEASDRLVLLAHWDTRPWADKDEDAAKRSEPVMGANDGASGVGVLLEMARILSKNPSAKGIDIVFVDLEDWGDYDNEDSWALGAQHFANNPFKEGYRPKEGILLDMVGGKDAQFFWEYFSSQYAPQLLQRVWSAAESAGFSSRFVNRMGTAVTDDHVQLIKAGVPAIDIIEYREEGFNPTWHTTADTIDNIDPASLKAVGQTLVQFILGN